MRIAHLYPRLPGRDRSPRWSAPWAVYLFVIATMGVAGCDGGSSATPAVTPGTADHPRTVIILAKDYTYVPAVLDLVPGESVLFQIINGGLAIHEVVIGTLEVQDAWESAEAATVGAPPGPTPVVSVPPDRAGFRVVVASGERVDITWTVPQRETVSSAPWLVGCHIPGHLELGMVVPIRFIDQAGQPLVSEGPSSQP